MPLTRHLSTRLGHAGRVAGQHFHPHPRSHPGQVVLSACKLYSHALAHPGQVVLSACELYSPRSSRARPPGSSALTATSFAQNTERLSCKQNLDSQWHRQALYLGLVLIDGSGMHISSPQITPVQITDSNAIWGPFFKGGISLIVVTPKT